MVAYTFVVDTTVSENVILDQSLNCAWQTNELTVLIIANQIEFIAN